MPDLDPTAQDAPQSPGMGSQSEPDDQTGSTFLINKEVYPEAKPGDTFTVRVERVHDAEMECSLVKGDEEQTQEPALDEGDGEPSAAAPHGGMFE